MRRDFTINALYYSIKRFTVLDYTNGIQDLADKKIRIIGDAVSVMRRSGRMLRVFAFKRNLIFRLKALQNLSHNLHHY